MINPAPYLRHSVVCRPSSRISCSLCIASFQRCGMDRVQHTCPYTADARRPTRLTSCWRNSTTLGDLLCPASYLLGSTVYTTGRVLTALHDMTHHVFASHSVRDRLCVVSAPTCGKVCRLPTSASHIMVSHSTLRNCDPESYRVHSAGVIMRSHPCLNCRCTARNASRLVGILKHQLYLCYLFRFAACVGVT